VVNASSTTVTVRNRRGETSTYTLSSNVTVIKVMVGRIADLAVGQTVQAVITTSGNALVVTILKA
jgi:hypothetical protein